MGENAREIMRFGGSVSAVVRSKESRLLGILILLAAIGGLYRPQLLSAGSINSVLLWVPILLVAACGQAVVVVQGGIDVSVGSALGLSAICMGVLFRSYPGMSVFLGAALCVVVGAILGLVNGIAVGRFRVPAIVVTLGTLSVFRGLCFVISKGEQVDANHLPQELTQLSLSGPVQIAGVNLSWLLIISLLVCSFGFLLVHRTAFGLKLFAVGGNSEAARVRTLPVGRTVCAAFVLCGATAGFAGFLYAARYGFVNPSSAGYGFELTVIAAVVLGGCSVRGGSGSISGVLVGCIFLGLVNTGLAVLQIEANYQLLAYGGVILFGLLVDKLLSQERKMVGATP